jgi:hypothetical protein
MDHRRSGRVGVVAVAIGGVRRRLVVRRPHNMGVAFDRTKGVEGTPTATRPKGG